MRGSFAARLRRLSAVDRGADGLFFLRIQIDAELLELFGEGARRDVEGGEFRLEGSADERVVSGPGMLRKNPAKPPSQAILALRFSAESIVPKAPGGWVIFAMVHLPRWPGGRQVVRPAARGVSPAAIAFLSCASSSRKIIVSIRA
jgi:hypothetical protein